MENQHSVDELISHWTKNLVGSSSSFSFNIMVSLLAGILYSFKIIPSGYILFIFGVVSPIIFTICMYTMILNSNGELMGQPLPSVFRKRNLSRLLMCFDCFLIVLFACLIYFDFINFFLFRFLQTVFFPVLLLVMLRSFYFILR